MVASSKCSTVAFISCDDMMLWINAICAHQMIDEGLELGIRYSCIEI